MTTLLTLPPEIHLAIATHLQNHHDLLHLRHAHPRFLMLLTLPFYKALIRYLHRPFFHGDLPSPLACLMLKPSLTPTIQELIAQGLNPNRNYRPFINMLHMACCYGNPVLAEYLLKAGVAHSRLRLSASTESSEKSGLSDAEFGSESERENWYDDYDDDGDNLDEGEYEDESGDENEDSWCVHHGTLLHIVDAETEGCIPGMKNCLKLLIAYGCDLETVDEHGFKPIVNALVDRRMAVSEVLLNHGARPVGFRFARCYPDTEEIVEWVRENYFPKDGDEPLGSDWPTSDMWADHWTEYWNWSALGLGHPIMKKGKKQIEENTGLGRLLDRLRFLWAMDRILGETVDDESDEEESYRYEDYYEGECGDEADDEADESDDEDDGASLEL